MSIIMNAWAPLQYIATRGWPCATVFAKILAMPLPIELLCFNFTDVGGEVRCRAGYWKFRHDIEIEIVYNNTSIVDRLLSIVRL
jgi:hypothetical protein